MLGAEFSRKDLETRNDSLKRENVYNGVNLGLNSLLGSSSLKKKFLMLLSYCH